ncbi:hypothetical protein A3F06_00150 [candidate division TM6 bacterium RIFCSPHIGHO2_12_FULL_36_22]|nr:MAG: hypothetical protein A3F06_00150 [candidate division TM6 bacterium RIFCSPHIGHO2_12_FULL_36_22]
MIMMYSDFPTEKGASNLLRRVFSWMTLALAITGATAWGVANYPPALMFIFQNPMIIFLLFFGQLGLVIYLSLRIQTMSYQAAMTSFLGYAFLNGLTFASIFLVYTHESIALVFFLCSAMFAAMTLYGYFTRADLSSMGSILFMGLIGLIISLFINMFLRSTQFDLLISMAGIAIFTLLTAYDVQQIKRLGQQLPGAPLSKVAILGALKLYLDFINLFLYLVRFFGQKRN